MAEAEVQEDAVQVAEKSGATVDDAVNAALQELGIARADAEIEVLSSGAASVPGESVIGSEARVRVRRADDYPNQAKGLLVELLERMEIVADVSVRRATATRPADVGYEPIILEVSGDDLGLLIGWRGETLRALQTVINLMMGDSESKARRLVIDVEQYRSRREDHVRELALRLADRVKESNSRYTLDPMQAYERRIVHLALEGDKEIRTESVGREPARRVVILPFDAPPLVDDGQFNHRPSRGNQRPHRGGGGGGGRPYGNRGGYAPRERSQ